MRYRVSEEAVEMSFAGLGWAGLREERRGEAGRRPARVRFGRRERGRWLDEMMR